MNEKIKKINELKEERAKLIVDQRSLLDKAEKDKCSLTADENVNYENMEKRFDEITEEIDVLAKEVEIAQKEELRKKKLEDNEKLMRSSQGHIPLDVNDDDDKGKRNQPEYAEYQIDKRYQSLIGKFRAEKGSLSTVEYLKAANRFMKGEIRQMPFEGAEFRALQADSDPAGGYLVAPEQMVMQVIEGLDNAVFVRRYANVISLPSAQSLGAPTRETDMGDLTWTGEILTGAEDSSLSFGKRDLYPHPLARRIKVSKKLIRISQIDIVGYVAKAFARKMGYVEENAFLNGTGVNSPLGVFTISDSGIDSGRDVTAGNTTTAMTADGLINCVTNLKAQYRALASCRWVFHRNAIKMIRKLKDGDGQYIWRSGLADKEPDRILGYPYEESEYAPSTFSSNRVGVIGDWGHYWIADSLAMEIQVLLELYAETAQNGYICRKETDGAPVLAEAFSCVKLG